MVRAGQIAGAHQEFAGNFAAGEQEGFPEQLHPVGFGQRMPVGDPVGERAVAVLQAANGFCVLDRRVDLQAVADDRSIGQQAGPVIIAVAWNPARFCRTVSQDRPA
jgi:hypothetical protein